MDGRDQHDRGQARAAAADRAGRALARRRADAIRTGRGRHGGAAGRAAHDPRGRGGQQLSLLRGSARPLRARKRDARRVAHGALPGRRDHAAPRRSRRPGRDAARTAALHVAGAGLARRADRRLHARRAGSPRRATGTTPPSRRCARATRPSRCRRETCSTSRPRSRRPTTPSARIAARSEAIAFAAYRLLVWQASYDANLAETFAGLGHALRGACFQLGNDGAPAGSPAAAGDRIAAAAIAAGGRDGSNERLHFADPTFTARNAPLIVGQAGSTVHDATFWQPLALAQVSPRGSGAVPAQVQSFVGSQWGRGSHVHRHDPGARACARRPVGARRTATRRSRRSAPPPAGRVRSTRRSVACGLERRAPVARPPTRRRARPGAERRAQRRRRLRLRREAHVRVAAADRDDPLSRVQRRAADRLRPHARASAGPSQVRLDGRWVPGDRWTPPAADAAVAGLPVGQRRVRLRGPRGARQGGRPAAPRRPRAAASTAGRSCPVDVAAGRRIGERGRAVGRSRTAP